VAHQVLVGVTEEVVAFGPAAAEVQVSEDRHELAESVLHFLAFAELLLVVEVGQVNDVLQIVGLGKSADDLVDSIADLLIALQLDHLVKRPAGWHLDQGAGIRLCLVRDVLDE
jgi:hypothetical protein